MAKKTPPNSPGPVKFRIRFGMGKEFLEGELEQLRRRIEAEKQILSALESNYREIERRLRGAA